MHIADTCLGNNDSLTLNTTAGFESYNWMGTITGSPSYQVYKEGQYHVTVNNYCGTPRPTLLMYLKVVIILLICLLPLHPMVMG